MKLTNSMKVAGELAVRSMSAKAQTGYAGTDPLSVYEYDDEDGKRYAIKDTDGTRYGLTFEQAEAELEAWVLEDEETED